MIKRIIQRGTCDTIKRAVAERKSCLSFEEWLGREEFKEKPLNVITHGYEQYARSLVIVEKLIKLVELELDEDYDNDMKEIMVTLLTVAATGILDPDKGEEIIGILSAEARKKIAEAVANGKMDRVMDILKKEGKGKEELVDAIFPKTGQV